MNLQALKAGAVALAAAALLLAGTAIADDVPAATSKWRVDFNGKAASDGEMKFRVTPHEGEPIIVTAKIHQGRAQIYIAADVKDTFKAQLPKERFRAEIVAGERVLVKAHSGEQAFLLELVESSVAGTHIHISPG
jgi:hypothetical protein